MLLCRFVPGVRSLISLPAGLAKMNLAAFLFYSTVGMGLWALGLAAAGWFLQSQWRRVESYMGPATYVVIGVIVVAAVAFVLYRRRAGKGRPRPEPS